MKATIKQNTIYRSSTYRFIPDIDIFIQILMMVPRLGNPSNNQEICSRDTRVPRTDLLDSKEYCPPLPPPTADEFESLITSPEPVETSRRKNKNENKRRFTDEQVKLLESMFETETKLEPRKKVLLARELGMQPRQVAIWFQNKRARWRSKHVEKEYTILKADYDDLKYRYESLKKEKQSLLMQMQKLSDMLQQPHDRSKSIEHLAGNSTDGNSENGDNNGEYEANPCRSEEGFMNKKVFMGLEEDRIRNNIRNPGFEEGHGIKNKGEQVDGSSASPEKWRRVVDACGVYDQPCSDSQWWEFWT